MREIKADLFIDDHHGNLEPITSGENPIPCLLFGDYPWNRARSGLITPGDHMTYDDRQQAGLGMTREDIEEGLYLNRVKGWKDVVEWVEKWDLKAVTEADDIAE